MNRQQFSLAPFAAPISPVSLLNDQQFSTTANRGLAMGRPATDAEGWVYRIQRLEGVDLFTRSVRAFPTPAVPPGAIYREDGGAFVGFQEHRLGEIRSFDPFERVETLRPGAWLVTEVDGVDVITSVH